MAAKKVSVISDMGGVRVLISMKYPTSEVMEKHGIVRLSADNTVSHVIAATGSPVTLLTTTVDAPFGICMNDKEAGLNADSNDMVDVLVFGRKDTLIGYVAPAGGMAVGTAYGPAMCIKAALENATAELIV